MEYNFEDFKKRATDKSLSKWEKIGFPDSYRKGKEAEIFFDIKNKLELENENIKYILDIGCGCSELVEILIQFSEERKINLLLNDSKEMLENIPKEKLGESNYTKLIPGYFPDIEICKDHQFEAKLDIIIVYSAIQYVFLEQNIYSFLHKCISLLKSGGRLLIGDIPNLSSRERFLKSEDGKMFRDNYSKMPPNEVLIKHENIERMDDAIVLSILNRFRNFDCETYLLPQRKNLPFYNRREDILIIKR